MDTGLHRLLVAQLGLQVPRPGVLEGLDLAGGLLAVMLREQHVVRRVGVERRVQVDEVYRFVRDVAPQDVEVVAVVEGVGHR